MYPSKSCCWRIGLVCWDMESSALLLGNQPGKLTCMTGPQREDL